MKSKLLMLLVVLLMLVSAVALSGCLGGDTPANNTTPEQPPAVNNTTPEQPPAENNTPSTPPSSGSVNVVLGEGGPTPTYFVQAKDQKYATSTLNISKGETVRFMNTETRNFRHLYHSENGAFEDFNLNPRYSATLTFNDAGTYKIELLNYYTAEPFGTTAPVLTVNVS
ncbi:MAG: hypothetical protein FWE78_06085 [Methanimicrococcus sp.]|nr:hypothetical protein [Methanimicrococcus sp.]